MVRIGQGKEGLEIMTYDKYVEYMREVDLGFINVNVHEEDENVIILNYTDFAVYEKRWNEYTMTARGLILDLSDVSINGIIYILSHPFDKFPNYNSNEIIGYEDDISWDDVDAITEKMDGSLGITYLHNGKINISTRGHLHSEQAKQATKIWREKYARSEEIYHEVYSKNKPTLMFEIIYPENRVVVDYGAKRDLVLIGVRDRHKDYTYEEMKEVADTLGLEIVKNYKLTLGQMLHNQLTMSANEEGYVIRFNNGKRVKIKGKEYLSVHRVKHGMSMREKYKVWYEKKHMEIIKSIPEEFRTEHELFFEKLDSFLRDETEMVANIYVDCMNNCDIRNPKEFGLYVSKNVEHKYQQHMFSLKKGDIPRIDNGLRYQIFKNYRTYELESDTNE